MCFAYFGQEFLVTMRRSRVNDRPMFVWSKLSSDKWADAWEERFSGEPRAVITKITGKPTLRLEFYTEEEAEAEKVRAQFGGLVREVKNQNWAAMSAELPEPVKVRDCLLVVSEREPEALEKVTKEHPKRKVITIPPDMAFGTGHHATTSTVLRLMVDFAKSRKGQPWKMLDLGTGSGLLAIAAEKLGASSAWGFDFDPIAVKVAQENVQVNQCQNVVLEVGDVFEWKPKEKYDLVAANLFTDILEPIFPKMIKSLKPDGILLISGILHTQAAHCMEVGTKAGFEFVEVIKKGKWVTARGVLKPKV